MKKFTPLMLMLVVFLKPLSLWPTNLFQEEQGKVSGTLTVNNANTNLNYAYAFPIPGFFDDSKEDIFVIITDVPLSDEAIEDNFERQRMMDNGDLHCLEVTVDANKNPISVKILHNDFKAPPSGRGYEVLEMKTFNKNAIEGKIFTTKLNDFFDTSYEYNVTFKAKIIRVVPPTAAEKEIAAKSPQATAYCKYEKTILDSDFDGLKKLVSKEILEEMSNEDAKEMFEFMQMTMPTNIKFLRVKVNGPKATLEMSAKEDGKIISGKATFLLEDKKWKVDQTYWKG